MSLSFVIYSDADKLISRHTVKDLAEKKAVVTAARKAYGKGLKVRDKELAKDRPSGKARIPMTDVEIKVCLQLDSDVEHTAEELTARASKRWATRCNSPMTMALTIRLPMIRRLALWTYRYCSRSCCATCLPKSCRAILTLRLT